MKKLDEFTRHKLNKKGSEAASMPLHFDRQGKPMGLGDWSVAIVDSEYKVVDNTEISDEVFVCTIWEGLDRGWPLGQNLIFSTAVIFIESYKILYDWHWLQKKKQKKSINGLQSE